MKELKSIVDIENSSEDNFTWIAKCSLRVVCMLTVPSVDSQEPRIRCPYTCARFKDN